MTQKEVVYAFIDSQNVNQGVKSQGWRLDWRKFRQYLLHKYHVTKAFLFIGQIRGNESLYTFLKKCGYVLILKPTLEHHIQNTIKIKGNVDAELVLHAMLQYSNYERAIIVSGDGDFHCLIKYLEEKNKLLLVLTPNRNYSRLLKGFSRFVVRVDRLKESLEQKK